MAYLPLQLSDDEAIEDLARLVAVAHILEGFGCVLATYIEQDFLSTAGNTCQHYLLYFVFAPRMCSHLAVSTKNPAVRCCLRWSGGSGGGVA